MVDRSASQKGKTANQANHSVGKADPWWKILKVSDTASLDEVAIAFRELAMQFHPDLWTNATEDQRKVADSRMKIINAAFEKAEHDISARQTFTAKVEQEVASRARQKTAVKAQQKATVRTKRKSAAKAKQEPIDTASQVMSNIFLNPTARKKLRKTKNTYAVVVSALAVIIFALIYFQNEYAPTSHKQAIAEAKHQEAIAKAKQEVIAQFKQEVIAKFKQQEATAKAIAHFKQDVIAETLAKGKQRETIAEVRGRQEAITEVISEVKRGHRRATAKQRETIATARKDFVAEQEAIAKAKQEVPLHLPTTLRPSASIRKRQGVPCPWQCLHEQGSV